MESQRTIPILNLTPDQIKLLKLTPEQIENLKLISMAAEVASQKVSRVLAKEEFDSVDISHYTSGTGHVTIPVDMMGPFAQKTPVGIYSLDSKDKLIALLIAGEFDSLGGKPFFVLVPKESAERGER